MAYAEGGLDSAMNQELHAVDGPDGGNIDAFQQLCDRCGYCLGEDNAIC
jgi:hypothetical protein